jgi:tRNA-splicing ligase RtcB
MRCGCLSHDHHNFAWKEAHECEELVVVRKCATPAFSGQLGFIGESMVMTPSSCEGG